MRQNLMLEVLSAASRRLQAGALETMNLDLAPGMAVGIMPLLVFLSAAVVMLSGPKGLLGHLVARFDLHLFPVQRRIRLLDCEKSAIGRGAIRRPIACVLTSRSR